MPDTGSELAQDLARSAAMMATRALDRAIADARARARMRARAAGIEGTVPVGTTRTGGAGVGPLAGADLPDRRDRILLTVLPTHGATREERAGELRDALAGRGADGVTVTYGTSGRTVVLIMDDRRAASAVQEAIEGLHADKDSTFDLSECFGLSTLEGATGRLTTYGPAPSTEHALVRFPGRRDALVADTYVAAMRRAGIDATHREIASARGTEHIATVAYPTRRRLDFSAAHARVLEDLRANAKITHYQPREQEQERERARDDARATDPVAPPEPAAGDEAMTTRDEALPGDVAEALAHEPREHVMAIFAGDPEHDRESAEAYVARMRERGYEPWHAAMGMGAHVHHTVELSYPASQRARFATDHVEALDAIGATTEVDVLEEPVRAGATLEELIEAHMAARDASAPAVEGVPEPPEAVAGATPPAATAPAHATTRAGDGRLTAREYLALPTRERARIPAERIPDGAFGAEDLADVARQARGASRALERGRERHVVPSIGERG